MRLHFLRSRWAGIAAALLGAVALHAADRPNILFIAVDDLRPELGCYGAAHIKSPNIDRLATRSVRFERAYCQYAICGPSRASLMTGLRPDTLKIEDIDTFFRNTVPDVVTLPQYFKQNGYTALYYGKVFHRLQEDNARSWSASPPPGSVAEGMEYQLPESRAIVRERRAAATAKYGANRLEGLGAGPAWEAADAPDNAYIDGRTADSAVKKLSELKAAGKPFFLGVGFHKPHLPFVAPKKYFDLYDAATMPIGDYRAAPAAAPSIGRHSSFELRTRTLVPLPGPIDDALSRELMRAYAACVSFVDAQVGKVLAQLDELGLRDNTIVVLWGDHGWHLGEFGIWGKATNHEIATRVPLIVSAPGLTAGASTKSLVEFVDVYPTLCELAGLPLPPHLEGKSFVPLLADPTRVGKTAAFSQFPTPALREWAARPLTPGMRQTLFGPLIEGVEAQLKREHGARYDQQTFERDVMGYSMRTERYRFTAWVNRRHLDDEPLALELYDHAHDDQERENVAGRPENRALVTQLQTRLLAAIRAEKTLSR